MLHPVSGHPEQYLGVLHSAKVPALSPPMDPHECANMVTVLQLLLYHSECQGVKRAATTYRRNIDAYWTCATFFSAPRIWQRYVIIRRAALPRYLWDRERKIEIEIVPGQSHLPICLPKCTAYLRNRNRLSIRCATLGGRFKDLHLPVINIH